MDLAKMTWDEMQKATLADETHLDFPDYYGQGADHHRRVAAFLRGKPRTVKSLKPSEIPLGMLTDARRLGY